MAPKCTICHHKQRESIDVDITSGVSNRTIATQYGVSISAVQRHRSHIPKALSEAKQAKDITRSDDLLEQLEKALKISWTVVNSCLEAGDNRTVLQGVKEIRESIKFLCEIAAELAKRKEQEVSTEVKTNQDYYDFSLLDDDELLTLERILEKCAKC